MVVLCVRKKKIKPEMTAQRRVQVQFEFHARKDEKDKSLANNYAVLNSHMILHPQLWEVRALEEQIFFLEQETELQTTTVSPVSRLTCGISPTRLCWAHPDHTYPWGQTHPPPRFSRAGAEPTGTREKPKACWVTGQLGMQQRASI